MNLELFIARKVHGGSGKNDMSRPAVIIATTGIALGIAVMLLSVAIVIGFKHQIRDKGIAFGSHIQISNYDNNQSYETKAITVSDSLLQELRNTPNVRHTQRYATKPGIIKTENDVQGIILKPSIKGDVISLVNGQLNIIALLIFPNPKDAFALTSRASRSFHCSSLPYTL